MAEPPCGCDPSTCYSDCSQRHVCRELARQIMLHDADIRATDDWPALPGTVKLRCPECQRFFTSREGARICPICKPPRTGPRGKYW